MPAPVPQPGPGRLSGWLFGAITVVPAMLAAAWLLPGFPLLLAGRFEVLPMVLMFAPLAAGLCYLAVRRRPATWPADRVDRADPGDPAGRAARRTSVPWWTLVATVAVAVVFAAWQIGVRTEQIIFLRDPVTYLQVGYWIAHHGTLPIPDSLAAFGGPHPGLGFASAGYYPRGASIVPPFMTGMPLVIAAAVWAGGIPAALVITPLIGGCAVLSFGGLAARLAGPGWAPAAAAVLALSLPEQYTSRSTFSEPLTQVLLFGGLCLLADSLVIRHRSDSPGEGGQDQMLAALAGLALGLTSLIRIDGLSDILPAVAFLGVLLVARRRQAVPFGTGLFIGVWYGLADGYLLSRPYLDGQAPSLRPLALIAAVVVLLTLAAAALTASPAARARIARSLTPKIVRWLPVLAAALIIALFIGFAVRPLAGRNHYYQDSLYWMIWYLGLPAVLLGAFGLAVLARRGLGALLTWRDPGAAARVWALPMMIAVWVILTVLWRPDVSPEQPWASARLVPFAAPGLILGAIYASAWLKEKAGQARLTSAAVACCCVASLLIPAVLTSFDFGVTSAQNRHLTARGLAFRRIGAGELSAVSHLCAAIGPNASVLILDQLTADRFAQVIRGICGTPAAVLTKVTPAAVSAVVTGIEGTGRRPVLLARQAAELAGYGGPPRAVVNLLTTQDAANPTSPPTGTRLIYYTVWLSRPAT